MKITISFGLILFSLFVFSFDVSAQKQSEKSRAVNAVKSFYRLHFGRDGDVTEKHLAQMRKFLAPELYESYREKLSERKEFLEKSPNSKTMFEQFGFELMPEACAYAYKIGKGEISGDAATVTVYLYNSKKCKYGGGALQATYQINLIKSNNQWLISEFSN